MGSALACARLQHVQCSTLYGELNVLHILEVLLKLCSYDHELLEQVRHHLLQGWQLAAMRLATDNRQVLGSSDTSHNILTLCVDQELAVEVINTVRWIPCKSNSCGTITAHVPKDHGLHTHSCPPGLRDVVQATVGFGPLIHPGAEDRTHGAPELVLRVLWEADPELLVDSGLVGHYQGFQIFRQQVTIEAHSTPLLRALQKFLKVAEIQAHHNIRVHLHEASVAVKSKATIA
mmetsp:Transcript_45450/g.73757  ORF Transcript_45450/g.73757 Transcript_45450/m.73757 type:complete len:233 (+) Transcript_45450:2406-3104(+)